ncbi:MAG: LysR family transcriptional regulator [Nitrospiraceae bacterium]|nr:LysR family transcriptional regulator [Nitrospiraceae bacterium]
MDIHHLKIFLSVYKSKSFSKASELVSLTQPTISEHIKKLETDLNCRLFDRMGKTIIPTKEADMLYNFATEIVEKAGNFKDALKNYKGKITGELAVGASSIPGTYILPRVIGLFRKKYPSATFQIFISDTKDVVTKIMKHELLLGVVGSKFINKEINYIPFMDDELIVIASPHFGIKKNISLGELIKFPLIMREEGSGTRREFEKFLDSKGISIDRLNITGFFNSTDAVKQAVKAGLGISVISRIAVADELKTKLLKEAKLDDFKIKRNFYLITHKKRTIPKIYNIFMDYISRQK